MEDSKLHGDGPLILRTALTSDPSISPPRRGQLVRAGILVRLPDRLSSLRVGFHAAMSTTKQERLTGDIYNAINNGETPTLTVSAAGLASGTFAVVRVVSRSADGIEQAPTRGPWAFTSPESPRGLRTARGSTVEFLVESNGPYVTTRGALHGAARQLSSSRRLGRRWPCAEGAPGGPRSSHSVLRRAKRRATLESRVRMVGCALRRNPDETIARANARGSRTARSMPL